MLPLSERLQDATLNTQTKPKCMCSDATLCSQMKQMFILTIVNANR